MSRYPSLLESSDVDGGSSVAVFTYLHRILESLNHPDLIHLILHYLLALPNKPVSQESTSSRPLLGISRRKTQDLLTNFPDMVDKPTPSLFNLVDLILSSMQSKSQQTVTATLKLVSVILRRHHRYAVATILQTSEVERSEPQQTIGAHNKQMETLFSLVSEIDGGADIDCSYGNHLKDNLNLLDSHPCSLQLLQIKTSDGPFDKDNCISSSLGSGPRGVHPHTLKPQDPFLQTLLQALRNFFGNTVELNLSLTETIIDLAACGHMRLEGWLVVDPARYEYDSDEYEDGDNHEQALDDELAIIMNGTLGSVEANERARTAALEQARREPFWAPKHTPPILAVLQSLTNQISTFRTEIPELNTYLSERRQVFQASDELAETLASAPPPTNLSTPQPKKNAAPSTPVSSTPLKIPTLSSVSQRMFSPSGSRSSSPLRGRPQRGSEDGRLESSSRAGRLERHDLKGSPTPSHRSRISTSLSPSRRVESVGPQPPRNDSADPAVLMRKIRVRSCHALRNGNGSTDDTVGGETSKDSEVGNDNVKVEDGQSMDNESVQAQGEGDPAQEDKEVSVNHLLTNIIILQEFILELAALIQVRASLFGEIKFL